SSGPASTAAEGLVAAARGQGRRRPAEVGVDGPGRLAPLADGPHDETLPAARVSGCEDPIDVRGVALGGDVATGVEPHTELVDEPRRVGSDEAHGEEQEIDLEPPRGPLELDESAPIEG